MKTWPLITKQIIFEDNTYNIQKLTKEKKYLIHTNQGKETAFHATYYLESKTKW